MVARPSETRTKSPRAPGGAIAPNGFFISQVTSMAIIGDRVRQPSSTQGSGPARTRIRVRRSVRGGPTWSRHALLVSARPAAVASDCHPPSIEGDQARRDGASGPATRDFRSFRPRPARAAPDRSGDLITDHRHTHRGAWSTTRSVQPHAPERRTAVRSVAARLGWAGRSGPSWRTPPRARQPRRPACQA